MASTLKHLRSSSADKRPTASGLADGQLAINTASGTPGLFFKDSGNGIVKVGPAHVDATAPNATPAGSAGNSKGEFWVDTNLVPSGLKVWNGSSFSNLTPSGSETIPGLLEVATPAEVQAGTDHQRAVTASGLQSKISDSTSTSSSTTIASSTAVKSAYDLANAALPKTGGTVTGAVVISPSGSLSFEGSSDDSFETTISVVNPTTDNTFFIPNITGTGITTADTGTVTNNMLAGSIADSKLSTISTADKVSLSALNIDGATDIGAALADADLFIVDDGGAGTNRKAAATRITDYAFGKVSGDITITSSGVAAIGAGVIVNADINASAAIAGTKISPDFGSQNTTTTGTSTAASFIPTSSGVPTNGLYLPSANNVAISTNGTGRLLIDANGNIQTNGAADRSSFLTVGGHTFGKSLIFDTGSGNDVQILNYRSTKTIFGNSGSGQMWLDSSGRLGLGTSSPSSPLTVQTSGATLAIRPLLRLENTVSGGIGGIGVGGSIDFYDEHADGLLVESARICSEVTDGAGTSRAADLAFYTTSSNSGASSLATEKVRIQGDGKVGIGTTSPGYLAEIVGGASATTTALLQIRSSFNDANTGSTLRFVNSTGNTSSVGAEITSLRTTAGGSSELLIGVGGTERARIDSSGRLLIGTSSAPSGPDGISPKIASASAAGGTGAADIQVAAYQNAGGSGRIKVSGKLFLGHSRSGTSGTLGGAVVDGDNLGEVRFWGDDGTNAITAAEIVAQVDGTPGANDMPGRLVFSTTADGASSPTERLRIDSSGRVGIGTTVPNALLEVSAGTAISTNGIIRIAGTNTNGSASNFCELAATQDVDLTSSALTFSTRLSGTLSEKVRIDKNGRLLVGTSTAINTPNSSGTNTSSALEIAGGSDTGNCSASLSAFSTITGRQAELIFAKSADNTVGSHTVVAADTDLGEISFAGSDGTKFVPAASILAEVDGTPGADDMPGRLVFSTTADGAPSPTERARIDSSGYLRLAGAGIQFNGDTAAANALDDYEEGTWTPVYISATGAFTSVTYDAVRYGKYTKIGNLVTCSFAIRTDAITVGTASGAVAVGGLPFTSTTTAGTDAGSGSVGYSAAFSGDAPIGMIASENSTSSILYYRATVNGNSNALDVTDLGTGANANYVIGVISYFVS